LKMTHFFIERMPPANQDQRLRMLSDLLNKKTEAAEKI